MRVLQIVRWQYRTQKHNISFSAVFVSTQSKTDLQVVAAMKVEVRRHIFCLCHQGYRKENKGFYYYV